MSAERFRRRGDRPLIYGHRGASAHATENTVAAVERARADGADGAEIDVQQAACGEVVVFHDDELARLAGRPERIRDLSFAALREIELERGKSGGRVPRLSDVLEASAGGFLLNVEIKTPGPQRAGALTDATYEILCRHGRQHAVIISSFDPTILRRLRRLDASLALGLLFHRQQSLPLRRAWLAPWCGANALHPDEGLAWGRRLQTWRRSFELINVWTVDDPRRARQLAAAGVDGLIANDPGRLRAALG